MQFQNSTTVNKNLLTYITILNTVVIYYLKYSEAADVNLPSSPPPKEETATALVFPVEFPSGISNYEMNRVENKCLQVIYVACTYRSTEGCIPRIIARGPR